MGKAVWINSAAINVGGLVTLVCLGLVVAEDMREGRVGRVLIVAGVGVSFWLGAQRCMDEGWAVRSWFIAGEIGGAWRARTVGLAVFYVALFQCLGLAGYRFGRVPEIMVTAICRRDTERRLLDDGTVACLLIGVMGSVLYVRYGCSMGGLVQGLAGARQASRSATDLGLAMNLVWLGYYGVALGMVRLVISPLTVWQRVVLPAAVLAGIVFVVADGTRHRLMYAFAPVCLVLLHRAVRVRGRDVGRLVVAGVVLFAVYQCQGLARDRGWRDLSERRWGEFLKVRGTDQFQSLNYALELVPRRHGYFRTPATPFFLTHWVPRRVWAGKWRQPELEYLSSEWTAGAGLDEFNVTPSIIGQYHMNWGVFGVAWIGLFMGWALRWLDELLKSIPLRGANHACVMAGMLGAFLAASFRHFSPQYIMLPVLGLGVFVACTVRPWGAAKSEARDPQS